MKQDWKPGTMIYPLPAALVSCGSTPDEYNILTVAWTGTICSEPAMCYISVRPERHSYPILKKNMEFVINLTTRDMAFATDWCGVRSGRDYNKFEEMHLTPGKAKCVKCPIQVRQCTHHRRVAPLHRMPCKRGHPPRLTRHVHCRSAQCEGRREVPRRTDRQIRPCCQRPHGLCPRRIL